MQQMSREYSCTVGVVNWGRNWHNKKFVVSTVSTEIFTISFNLSNWDMTFFSKPWVQVKWTNICVCVSCGLNFLATFKLKVVHMWDLWKVKRKQSFQSLFHKYIFEPRSAPKKHISIPLILAFLTSLWYVIVLFFLSRISWQRYILIVSQSRPIYQTLSNQTAKLPWRLREAQLT